MKKYLRKKIYIIVGLTMLAILMSLSIQGYTNENKGQKDILSINGIPVEEEEFKMFLQDEKALTVNYFSTQYGVEYSDTFWTTQYGEEIPLEVAKKNAQDKIAKIKIEQQLAQTYGILESIAFKDLEKNIKSQESIYGMENMDPFQAYTIYHSKIAIDTMQAYKLATPSIAEEILETAYERDKQTLFRQPDDIKALQINLEDLPESSKEEVLRNIKEDLSVGRTIRELEEKYSTTCTFTTKMKEYGRNENKEENGTELETMLKEITQRLETNQMSEPVAYGNTYYIMVCLEKAKGERVPFETAKISIEDSLKEEAFEKEVDKQVRQAKIIINEVDYLAIQMD